jgi:hypothetical protein
MSAMPDPAELAPSRDPAAYGRRRLFTPSFFAWAALCVLCLVAGAAIGRFGVQFATAAKETSAPDSVQRPPLPIAASAPAAAMPAAGVAAAPAPGADQLADRLTRLESASARANDAARAALAAAGLSEAAQSAAPFDQDLAAYQRLMPASLDLRALAPLAVRGAPGRMALAASLPDVASQASAASREPAKSASLLSRLAAMIGQVVIVRRVDPRAIGVDGVLARAEAQAAAGRLEGAVAELRGLPPPVRAPLDDWIAAAERRIEIDQRIEAIRAQALADLVQTNEARP